MGHETIAGVAIGIVTANDDPEGLGRVKLNLPWRAEHQETDWARVAAPMAGGNRGVYFLPEVGDEVLVAFEGGDIRFPYMLGALWNATDAPPASNDKSNDVRLIRSRKGHMLRFDDASRKGAVTIELNDGKKVEIDDEGIRISDGVNTIALETRKGEIVIEAGTRLSLKAPQISYEPTASPE